MITQCKGKRSHLDGARATCEAGLVHHYLRVGVKNQKTLHERWSTCRQCGGYGFLVSGKRVPMLGTQLDA